MTRSDELMLAAVNMRTDLAVNGRKVSVDGDDVIVSLHDMPVVRLRMGLGYLRICPGIPCTRKSSRVLNAVLEEYTDCRVRSLNGTWLLEQGNTVIPFGNSMMLLQMHENVHRKTTPDGKVG